MSSSARSFCVVEASARTRAAARRLAADFAHGGGNIPGPFNAFKRRAHVEKPGKSSPGEFLSRRGTAGEVPGLER